ncbi:MAG: nuclease [Calothrix sp. MO_167.B42]|nr:nuclease [Calothrix sp. MO_167.B42]
MPFILLDSQPLSLITNPRDSQKSLGCKNKIKKLIRNNILVVVPEIIDYELRRTLICGEEITGIKNLNRLGDMGIVYMPINTEIMNKASELWAWARRTGQSTAHKEKIDIDVILAAQAIILAKQTQEYTIVATSNVSDIQRYTYAKKLEDIELEDLKKTNNTRVLTQNKLK